MPVHAIVALGLSSPHSGPGNDDIAAQHWYATVLPALARVCRRARVRLAQTARVHARKETQAPEEIVEPVYTALTKPSRLYVTATAPRLVPPSIQGSSGASVTSTVSSAAIELSAAWLRVGCHSRLQSTSSSNAILQQLSTIGSTNHTDASGNDGNDGSDSRGEYRTVVEQVRARLAALQPGGPLDLVWVCQQVPNAESAEGLELYGLFRWCCERFATEISIVRTPGSESLTVPTSWGSLFPVTPYNDMQTLLLQWKGAPVSFRGSITFPQTDRGDEERDLVIPGVQLIRNHQPNPGVHEASEGDGDSDGEEGEEGDHEGRDCGYQAVTDMRVVGVLPLSHMPWHLVSQHQFHLHGLVGEYGDTGSRLAQELSGVLGPQGDDDGDDGDRVLIMRLSCLASPRFPVWEDAVLAGQSTVPMANQTHGGTGDVDGESNGLSGSIATAVVYRDISQRKNNDNDNDVDVDVPIVCQLVRAPWRMGQVPPVFTCHARYPHLTSLSHLQRVKHAISTLPSAMPFSSASIPILQTPPRNPSSHVLAIHRAIAQRVRQLPAAAPPLVTTATQKRSRAASATSPRGVSQADLLLGQVEDRKKRRRESKKRKEQHGTDATPASLLYPHKNRLAGVKGSRPGPGRKRTPLPTPAQLIPLFDATGFPSKPQVMQNAGGRNSRAIRIDHRGSNGDAPHLFLNYAQLKSAPDCALTDPTLSPRTALSKSWRDERKRRENIPFPTIAQARVHGIEYCHTQDTDGKNAILNDMMDSVNDMGSLLGDDYALELELVAAAPIVTAPITTRGEGSVQSMIAVQARHAARQSKKPVTTKDRNRAMIKTCVLAELKQNIPTKHEKYKSIFDVVFNMTRDLFKSTEEYEGKEIAEARVQRTVESNCQTVLLSHFDAAQLSQLQLEARMHGEPASSSSGVKGGAGAGRDGAMSTAGATDKAATEPDDTGVARATRGKGAVPLPGAKSGHRKLF